LLENQSTLQLFVNCPNQLVNVHSSAGARKERRHRAFVVGFDDLKNGVQTQRTREKKDGDEDK
jgi:hypothetical protein